MIATAELGEQRAQISHEPQESQRAHDVRMMESRREADESLPREKSILEANIRAIDEELAGLGEEAACYMDR